MFNDLTKRADVQTPFDVAVIVPTILRPSLARALTSVFVQDFPGRVQILVGIDVHEGDSAILDALAANCPARMHMLACRLPYSTSIRHGGLYPNRFSGALRSILTLAANARLVAYLDDDNWWAPEHLSSLVEAIDGVDWAWSTRWFADPETAEPIAIDDWESVGPDAGVFAARDGGFVDTSSLMIDKLACHDLVPLWSLASFADGSGEDRLVFAALKESRRGRPTGHATSYYGMRESDAMHTIRLEQLHARGIVPPSLRRLGARPLAELVPLLARPARLPAPDPILAALVGHIAPREILALAAGSESALHGLAAAAPNAAIALAETPPAAGSLAVDLVHVGPTSDPARLAASIDSGWDLLRPGGILMGPGPVADPATLRRFAAAHGVILVPEAVEDAVYWLVQKTAG